MSRYQFLNHTFTLRMSANPLDQAIDAFQTWVERADFHLSPLTISVTLLALLLPVIVLLLLAVSQREQPPPPPEACRKLGREGPSNLTDQFSKKYSKGVEASSSNLWRVKAIFVYPIKSCKGIELEHADVVETGLKYDRQFALAQLVTSLPTLDGKVTSEWTFITQRTFPRLAKVETELWYPEPKAQGDLPGKWAESEGCLVVRFPFTPDTDFSLDGLRAYGKILAARLAGLPEPMVEFRIPFNPTKEQCKNYKLEKMNIWKDCPVAMNMTPEIPEEVMAKLRYTLGVANPLALFRIDTKRYREVHKCAPKKKDIGFQPIIGMQDSVRALPSRSLNAPNLPTVPHAHNQPIICSRRLLTAT